MAKNKSEIKTEYIDITDEEVKRVIEGISQAVDKMVHEFGFSMSVMDQIARLLHESPPNFEMVRIMLSHFFDVDVSDHDEEDMW